MPRLSLWKPTKTNDYYFMDRTILEQFKIGGTGMNIHKYIGPAAGGVDDSSLPNYQESSDDNPFGWVDELSIQDLTLMETRDRKYDPDIYELRGHYNVTDNDFDLTQFGIFLTQDTIFMTFHINDMIETIGRKLMNGDVIEPMHLRDYTSLDANSNPIPKFYVVQDANRASEGFSQTWYPHLWRVKLGPITDSQEFNNILGNNEDENSLASTVSVHNKVMDINTKVKESAEKNAPSYVKNTQPHIYDGNDGPLGVIEGYWGNISLGVPFVTKNGEIIVTQNGDALIVSDPDASPVVDMGPSFPVQANNNDIFLRTDFFPVRLYRKDGPKWTMIGEQGQAESWKEKTFNAGSFVENVHQINTVNDKTFAERQSVSRPIPKHNQPLDEGDNN